MDRRCAHSAILGSGLAPLLRGHGGGDIAHVGDRWFHRHGVADAIEPPFTASVLATNQQFLQPTFANTLLYGGGVVTRIEQCRSEERRVGKEGRPGGGASR